jgi:3-deoxy-manno-octulosonate cytidylyltransferase (CMP-KDO synthetase)
MSAVRDIVVVVPARYGSSRFPGKPLAMLRGKSLLERSYRIACAAKGVSLVLITTDDERIARHAESFGAAVVMTDSACATGSDRVAQATAKLTVRPHAVLNLQGDAVLTPPWVLEALVPPLRDATGSLIATPAVRLDAARYEEFVEHKRKTPTSGTTVTVNARGEAMYFSKAVIPFLRARGESLVTSRTSTSPSTGSGYAQAERGGSAQPFQSVPVFRHIGVYGYTVDALERFTALPQSELEKAEGLEQLRALENCIPIRVVEVDYRGRTHASVDTPEDLAMAEAILSREGELC